MKGWIKLLPILSVLAVAIPLNVDLSVVPYLRIIGLVGFKLFAVVYFLATLEILYSYWFCRWLGREAEKLAFIKNSINFGKEIKEDLEQDEYVKHRYLYRVREYCLGQYRGATNPSNWLGRLIKLTGRRVTGHGVIILVGVFLPWGRTAGVIFCFVARWRAGLVTLLIANLGHVAIVVWGWSYLWSKMGW